MKKTVRILLMFILIFFLGFSTGKASGATLISHVMSLYPPPANCATPQAQYSFHLGDPVMSWWKFSGCKKGDLIQFVWFNSNMTYQPFNVIISEDGDYCVWAPWSAIPGPVGQWGVHVFYSNAYVGSDSFTVIFPFDTNAYYLQPADNNPLGKRCPLILIHGNHMEDNGYPFGWDQFASNAILRQYFKIYVFRWNTKKSDQAAAKALGYLMDANGELINSSSVILTHSRGALPARYHANDYKILGGTFNAQAGGARIKSILTMAAPHHGTPGADLNWVNFSIDQAFGKNKPLALAIEDAYDNLIYDAVTFPALCWDDQENILTNGYVCWDSTLMNKSFCTKLFPNSSLLDLNKRDKYFAKLIVYGGNNFNRESLSVIATDPCLFFPTLVCRPEHRRLDLGSSLMATMPIIPNGYPQTAISSKRPFEANDGMVPLSSALFLKPGHMNTFFVNSKGILVCNNGGQSFAKESYYFTSPVDHLDFLDNSKIVNAIISKLLSLK